MNGICLAADTDVSLNRAKMYLPLISIRRSVHPESSSYLSQSMTAELQHNYLRKILFREKTDVMLWAGGRTQ